MPIRWATVNGTVNKNSPELKKKKKKFSMNNEYSSLKNAFI